MERVRGGAERTRVVNKVLFFRKTPLNTLPLKRARTSFFLAFGKHQGSLSHCGLVLGGLELGWVRKGCVGRVLRENRVIIRSSPCCTGSGLVLCASECERVCGERGGSTNSP